MTAISYIESVKSLPLNLANIQMETFCGISNFFRDADDICSIKCDDATDNVSKEEYGDWQTSMELALSVCRLLKEQGINPHVIVEPTCGKGHFILAALQTFDSIEDIYTYIEFEILNNNILKINNIFEM